MSISDSRSTLALAFICLGLTACSSSGAPEPEVALAPVEAVVSPSAGVEAITAEAMMSHITYLASDELAGRDTPSPGLEKAAAYIQDAFRAAGLEPAGDGSSYLQRWPFEKTVIRGSETVIEASAGGDAETLQYGVDFFVLPGTDETVSADAAFFGPIDTFLGESVPDACGRIAVVTTPPSMGMEILLAARAAGEAGAAALVLILAEALPPEVISMVAGQIEGSGLPLQPVPTAGITWEVAERWFDRGEQDLGDLAGGDEEAPPADAPIELTGMALTVRAPLDRESASPPNVVGLVRGSDPELAGSYIVLSAHFDHLGIGEANAEGDSIYNGADDDASGTAVLLEVARGFQAVPRAPRRSVVLLAVSGEEKGLLGARHWVDQPTVPLGGVVANINLDMIGRNAPDTLIAIGQEFTSLGDLSRSIAERNPALGLTIAPDPDPAEQAFFRSDHLAFVQADIPAIFFTTWDHEDYHQPSDEASRIDADKAARVARLAFLLTWAIAEDEVAPTWNEGALEEVHALLEDSPFLVGLRLLPSRDGAGEGRYIPSGVTVAIT
jgi:hypothetical protein